MVATLISNLYAAWATAAPPGFIICVAIAFIEKNQYLGNWIHEMIGTMLMVTFTFSPGKWVGQTSLPLSWLCHAIGVVAADKIGGGPHVNPAVSVAMVSIGKASYTEGLVRIFGAMAGGLIIFPLCQQISEIFGLTPLGGPEFHAPDISLEDVTKDDVTSAVAGAFYNEFFATMILVIAIYVLNFELNFGKYHYWIKQPLTAGVIRYIIQVFPATGPAINPMLGTTWAVFSEGSYPEDHVHYFVYWVGACSGALVGSILYVVYVGGTFFGKQLPVGPIRKPAAKPASAPSSPGKKKK